MNLLENDIKSRYRALKMVLEQIEEMKANRINNVPNYNELEHIEKYVNIQINNYRQLVKDLNSKIGS